MSLRSRNLRWGHSPVFQRVYQEAEQPTSYRYAVLLCPASQVADVPDRTWSGYASAYVGLTSGDKRPYVHVGNAWHPLCVPPYAQRSLSRPALVMVPACLADDRLPFPD